MREVYNVIQLLVFIQGVLLAVVVLLNRKSPANRYLGIFIILLSLLGLGSTIDISHFPHKAIPLFFSMTIFLFGPLFYRYIWHGLFHDYKPTVPFVIHCIPSVLYTGLMVYLLMRYGSEKIVTYILTIDPSIQVTYYFIAFGQAVSGLSYSIFSIRLLVIHRESLKRWTQEKERFRWFLIVLIGFLANWILVAIQAAGNEMTISIIDILTALAHLAMLYLISFFAMKYPTFLSPKEVREEIRKKLNLDEDFIEETLRRLTKAENEGFYRDSEITLQKMAKKIGLHSNALSFIINEKKGMGFRKYLNSLRLRDFVELMKEKSHGYTQLDMAFEVGFSSKSTFLRAFKEEHNCSPSEFFK